MQVSTNGRSAPAKHDRDKVLGKVNTYLAEHPSEPAGIDTAGAPSTEPPARGGLDRKAVLDKVKAYLTDHPADSADSPWMEAPDSPAPEPAAKAHPKERYQAEFRRHTENLIQMAIDKPEEKTAIAEGIVKATDAWLLAAQDDTDAARIALLKSKIPTWIGASDIARLAPTDLQTKVCESLKHLGLGDADLQAHLDAALQRVQDARQSGSLTTALAEAQLAKARLQSLTGSIPQSVALQELDRVQQLVHHHQQTARSAIALLAEGHHAEGLAQLAKASEQCNTMARTWKRSATPGQVSTDNVEHYLADDFTPLHRDLMAEAVRLVASTPAAAARLWVELEGAMVHLHKQDTSAPDWQRQKGDVARLRELARDIARSDGNGQSPHAQKDGVQWGKDLGSHYTTWGRTLNTPFGRFSSVGEIVAKSLRILSGSAAARALGLAIQKGQSKESALYKAGAVIKGFANFTGGICSFVGATVTFAETIVSNVLGATLRLAGASGLGLLAAGAKVAGLASSRADAASAQLFDQAKQTAGFSWWVKGRQVPLPASMAHRTLMLSQLFRYTSTGTAWTRDAGTLGDFSHVEHADIPKSVLRMMEFKPNTSTLTTHSWSGLQIGVYKEPNPADPNKPRIVLTVIGTKAGLPATIKADIAQALGIEDSTYRKVNEVVAAFKEQYGDRLELVGHSLGGGLATWAGVLNDVPVTTFNAAGLHVQLRNRLGTNLLNQARVVNINNEGDWLSQGLENRRMGFTASSQLGPRYVVEGAPGHKLSSTVGQVSELHRSANS